MKKVIAFILTLLILFSGCSNATQTPTNTMLDDMEFFGILQVPQHVRGYNEYISKYRAYFPENFVMLSTLPNFGDFGYFVVNASKFPNEYEYSFNDTRESFVNLRITHLTENSNEPIVNNDELLDVSYNERQIGADMTSMKKISSNGIHYFIAREGLEYYYHANGYLSQIVWHVDNIQFTLYGNFTEYDSSLYNRLISISKYDIISARDEIMQALTAK